VSASMIQRWNSGHSVKLHTVLVGDSNTQAGRNESRSVYHSSAEQNT
jgi:hypothetical protein